MITKTNLPVPVSSRTLWILLALGAFGCHQAVSATPANLGVARATSFTADPGAGPILVIGGGKDQEIDLVQGDVVVLPAGTGHQSLWTSPDLVVIGAYPKSGRYDLCRATKVDHDRALGAIANVPLTDTDPVFGMSGPLLRLWQS